MQPFMLTTAYTYFMIMAFSEFLILYKMLRGKQLNDTSASLGNAGTQNTQKDKSNKSWFNISSQTPTITAYFTTVNGPIGKSMGLNALALSITSFL